jgi:hypothetical protein
MSNKKQTAVEWLISEVNKYLAWSVEGEPKAKPYTNKDLVQAMEQAKEMEKEQIKDAFMEGDSFEGRTSKKDFEHYYTETYNTPKP